MSPLLVGLALGGAAMYFFEANRARRRANDDVLASRVRSTIRPHVAHPATIDVLAADGRVTLNGPIPSHERPDLIESVGAVPGVRQVVDELAVYETAESLSELQGAGR